MRMDSLRSSGASYIGKIFSSPQPQVAPNFLKRSFSPKFLKSLRRGTFKSTASVKCHFFLLQLNFLKRKPSQTKIFLSLGFIVQVFSCCARVVFHSRQSIQMFVAILKNVVLFPNH